MLSGAFLLVESIHGSNGIRDHNPQRVSTTSDGSEYIFIKKRHVSLRLGGGGLVCRTGGGGGSSITTFCSVGGERKSGNLISGILKSGNCHQDHFLNYSWIILISQIHKMYHLELHGSCTSSLQ
jgi:hypothetical protein